MVRTPKQARCTNCRQLLKPGAPNSIGSGDIWAHQECPPINFHTRLLRGSPSFLSSRNPAPGDPSIPQGTPV